MTDRQTLAKEWLDKHLPQIDDITILPGDASFRRYSRIYTPQQSYMFMDAPPELEDCHSFVAIDEAYRQHGVHTPKIYAKDLELGFILLEDFGDTLLSQVLTPENAAELYRKCYLSLPHIQVCRTAENHEMPHFDGAFIMTELKNFYEWCVIKFAELELTTEEDRLLSDTFGLLMQNAEEQPQVGVHRDYHSRNLMVLANSEIGVIDFQDAVIGPITYDLVSLLRDCYVSWPNEDVVSWVKNYYHECLDKPSFSYEQFQRWFDLMGIQRHLKAVFIFCRKYLRDDSLNYLEDIRRGLNYVRAVNKLYPELKAFDHFIENRLMTPLFRRIDYLLNNR